MYYDLQGAFYLFKIFIFCISGTQSSTQHKRKTYRRQNHQNENIRLKPLQIWQEQINI